MHSRPRQTPIVFIGSAALVLALVGILQGINATSPSPDLHDGSVTTASEPTVTAGSFPFPIMTESEALNRLFAELPSEITVTQQTAQLVGFDTFAAWDGRPTTTEFTHVWIAGAEAEGLRTIDTLGFVAQLVSPSDVPNHGNPAEGAYIAWDANSGLAVAYGALVDGTTKSIDTIESLPTSAYPVSPATPMPSPTPE